MSSVALFKLYLKEKLKGKEPSARQFDLSLYHYLCFFCQENQPITEALIREFCQKALLFPYWQSRTTYLRKRLVKELIDFSQLYGPLAWDLKSLASIEQWQWVRVWRSINRLNIIRLYLKSQKDKVRLLPLEGDKTLALILAPSGALKALSFGSLFLIDQGQIRPLTPLSQLSYNAQYELSPNSPQKLEIKSGHFIHFRCQGRKVTGQGSQGFCFHLAEEFQQKNIQELAFLFLPLKKMESLFIEPSSDPDYQKLVRSLSQSYHKLLTQPYSADLKAELALFQARKTLQNLYPQDSLLLLLTANIEYHLRKKHQTPAIKLETAPSYTELVNGVFAHGGK